MPFLFALVGVLWAANKWLETKNRKENAYEHVLHQQMQSTLRAQQEAEERWRQLNADLEDHEPDEDWIKSVTGGLQSDDEEFLYCDGHIIQVRNPMSLALLRQVQTNAINQGMYNSKNLEDGGWWELLVDNYRAQGLSQNEAEVKVLAMQDLGIVPGLYFVPEPQ